MTNEVAHYLASYIRLNLRPMLSYNQDGDVDIDDVDLANLIVKFFEELP